jgi:hypothetical protein
MSIIEKIRNWFKPKIKISNDGGNTDHIGFYAGDNFSYNDHHHHNTSSGDYTPETSHHTDFSDSSHIDTSDSTDSIDFSTDTSDSTSADF